MVLMRNAVCVLLMLLAMNSAAAEEMPIFFGVGIGLNYGVNADKDAATDETGFNWFGTLKTFSNKIGISISYSVASFEDNKKVDGDAKSKVTSTLYDLMFVTKTRGNAIGYWFVGRGSAVEELTGKSESGASLDEELDSSVTSVGYGVVEGNQVTELRYMKYSDRTNATRALVLNIGFGF